LAGPGAPEEGVEDVTEAEPFEATEGRAARGAHAGVPEHVVGPPLLGVRQHLVRLAALLEALFGLRVVGVAVGVVLQGELPEGTLQLLRAGVSAYTEHLVVVALDGQGGKPTSANQVVSAGRAGGLDTLTRAGRITRSRKR